MNLKFIAWEPVAEGVYKVVVERQQGTDVPTVEDFQQGVNEILGFGFKVKDNVSEVVSASGRCYDRLVLEVAHDEISADDDSISAFAKVSAHVYRNKSDDSLYRVVKAEDGSEKLVREDTIDGDAILEKQEVDNYDDKVADLLEPDVYAGDYVSYISNDGDIKEGWVANEEDDSAQYVIDEENDEEEIVNAAQYLSVVPSTHQVIASFNAQDENYTEDAVAQIKKYYSNVDFMSEVRKALGDSTLVSVDDAALASLVMPKTTAGAAAECPFYQLAQQIAARYTQAAQSKMTVVPVETTDAENVSEEGAENACSTFSMEFEAPVNEDVLNEVIYTVNHASDATTLVEVNGNVLRICLKVDTSKEPAV